MKKVLLTSALLAILASCARDEIPAPPVDQKASLTVSSVTLNEMRTKSSDISVGSQLQIIYGHTNQAIADRKSGVFEYSTLDGGSGPVWHPKTPGDALTLTTPPEGQYHQIGAIIPAGFLDGKLVGQNGNSQWTTVLEHMGYYSDVSPWTSGSKDFCAYYNSDLTEVNPRVNITLEHIFSMLHLHMTKASDFMAPEGKIQSVSIKAKGMEETRKFNENMYAWEDQAFTHQFYTKSFDVSSYDLSLNNLTEQAPALDVKFIMLPMSFDEGSIITVAIRVDGVNYEVNIPQSQFLFMDMGKRCIIEVNFTKTGLKLGAISQKEWDDVNVTNGVPLLPSPVHPIG